LAIVGCLDSGPLFGVWTAVVEVVVVGVVVVEAVLVTCWTVAPADGASTTPGAFEAPQPATPKPRAPASAAVVSAFAFIDAAG
jgi:hypothetical protein